MAAVRLNLAPLAPVQLRRLQLMWHRWVAALDYIAGTAGRHGYEEFRTVAPTPAAWRALDDHAQALGITPARLDHFIAAHYSGVGLHRRQDIRTLADLNRVLWGLKALLRHRRRPSPAPPAREPRAA